MYCRTLEVLLSTPVLSYCLHLKIEILAIIKFQKIRIIQPNYLRIEDRQTRLNSPSRYHLRSIQLHKQFICE